MVAVTYPGVYIEEISSGVRTIVGVATSITAFIGRTPRGLVEKATVVNSFGDFVRRFGDLDPNFTVPYAVRDFFQNGGGQAVIVRLYNPNNADYTAAVNTALAAATPLAQAGADAITTALTALFTNATLTVKELADGIDAAVSAVSPPEPERIAAAQTVATAAKKALTDKGLAEAASAAPTQTDVTTAATTAKPNAVKNAAEAAALKKVPPAKAQIAIDKLLLEAVSPGSWGNNLHVTVWKGSKDGTTPTDEVFNLLVQERQGQTVLREEKYINLTHEDAPNRVDRVLKSRSSLINAVQPLPTAKLPGLADALKNRDVPPDATKDAKDNVVTTEAGEGGALAATDYQGNEVTKKGIYALEDADLFNLLCVPPDARGGDVLAGIPDLAAGYCRNRRAVFIADPPVILNPDDAVSEAVTSLRTNLNITYPNSKNAAVYFPRVLMNDPMLGNLIDTFPGCGVVAGVIARTDAQRGVWKAPAGIEAGLSGVIGFAYDLTDAENGQLNPLGINCLRSFRDYGRVVWGARTLAGADALADEYKYLPVRRLALYIEESLFRGLHWVVFEPNDEPLWAQIRLNVGSFMNGLFKQGAFAGTTTTQAYFVKCDRENNPQSEIDLGKVHIRVGFAPLKPAEFVIIELQQIAGKLDV